MINTLPSALVFLASEKISSDSLFEGFNVDLESTANLVKSLADYNPTVWSYMSAITKGIMQPLGVAVLAVVLILEFSKMAKKIANSGGAMTFEAIAPMIVSYIMVAGIFYLEKVTRNFKKKLIRNTIYIMLLSLSMYYSIEGLLYWVIPQEKMDLNSLLVTLLISVLIMSIEFKIFINTNGEEENYMNLIDYIKNNLN